MSLRWGGRLERGRNRVKKEGYFREKLEVEVGRWRSDLRREAVDRGRDLEGVETMWSLRDTACWRSFSRWTAKSRYGSRTHLTLASTKLRNWCRLCSWRGSLVKGGGMAAHCVRLVCFMGFC